MYHPLKSAALNHVIRLSAELEVQLTGKEGHRPMLEILARAREAAAEAMIALTMVKPTDADLIREQQNIVSRYTDLIHFTREILVEGIEGDQIVAYDAQEDILESVGLSEQDRAELAKLGISPQDGAIDA